MALPVAFSDASHKADPQDSCKQYGYNITWQGGPVVYVSKKLSHVGFSASHNEYMAMCEAGKAIVWVRQILEELGYHDILRHPTVLFGDNKAANSLTSEHFVSTGNQYIYMPYHAIKEWTELKIIDVQYKASKSNLADLFTKNVSTGEIRTLLDVLCGYSKPALEAYMVRLMDTDVYTERQIGVMRALLCRMTIQSGSGKEGEPIEVNCTDPVECSE